MDRQLDILKIGYPRFEQEINDTIEAIENELGK